MRKENFPAYIVDDDVTFSRSLQRLLKASGYPAETFYSPQTFLDSVPVEYKKGILILDLRMPGMDGFALQKKLNDLRSDLKVIFITADAKPGDRSHAMTCGAKGFLQKPFQEESLLEIIRRVMNEDD